MERKKPGRKPKYEYYDSPDQINKCLNCKHGQCIDCVSANGWYANYEKTKARMKGK